MEKGTTYVGMDTSKTKIALGKLPPDESKVVGLCEISSDEPEVRRMVKRIQREAAPGEVLFCYEAGPCGYALQRQIESLGSRCLVIAPSLIPVKPGERIKTNRRDAKKLTELLRAGLLTEVRPPTPEEESVRDLCRSREDAIEDRARCRHRLSKMLLRRGLMYTKGGHWTGGHWRWLESLSWENEADRVVFNDYVLAVQQVEARLKNLDTYLEAFSQKDPYRVPVGYLRCFRGIDTLTAMTVVAELHGPERFRTAPELMAYLGLVPSENSTGNEVHRGRITKAGNAHVRRVLTEASHSYRNRPSARGVLAKRRKGQPDWVIAIADKAMQRLHQRFWHLLTKGKPYNKVVIALERELVGFIWAVLTRHHNAQQVAA